MIKCPMCGNTEFPTSETDQELVCPVAGCKGVIRAKRESDVRAWIWPVGGSFEWINQQTHRTKDQKVQLLFCPLEEGRAEVSGFRGELPQVLTVPGTWQGRRVTQIGAHALQNLPGVRVLRLPDEVESIEYEGVSSCGSLETIEFGSGVLLIDAFAFKDCARLQTIRAAKPPLCVMDTAFAGCGMLAEAERSKLLIL